MNKQCKRCGESKPLDMFGGSTRTLDARLGICRACYRAYINDYRRRNASRRNELVNAIRARNRALAATASIEGCVDCGEKDPDVLDFDHVRGDKTWPVSRLWNCSSSTVLAEVAKCEVRCANCHRRITAMRRRKQVA